jgi:hypothetical protein
VGFEPGKVTVTREELEESDLVGEETINARERVYKALKSFENEEGTKSDIVDATSLAEGTVKKELAALKKENPPRVWDTGRSEGRQAIVTTKKPEGTAGPSGSGSNIYKGTGTGTDETLSSCHHGIKGGCGICREPEQRAYTYVTNEASLDEALCTIVQAEHIGMDMETVGTDPKTGTLRLVQISDGENTFIIDASKVDPKPLLEFIADKEFIAHNAFFELSWLKEKYGIEPKRVHDTMLMSQILHAGEITAHNHGLSEVASRELGMELVKDLQTSDWSAEGLSDEQLAYAALDAQILPGLYRKLKEAAKDA